MIERRAELAARLDAIDREQREAGQMVTALSEALTQLERRGLAGEKVTDAERRKAEDALASARAAVAAPWGERRSALRLALADEDGAIQMFAAQHFAVLVREVEEDGADATRAMNDACSAVIGAHGERARHAARLDALIAVTRGRSNYGDVKPGRGDVVVRHAADLLSDGGEVDPVVRPDFLPQPSSVDDVHAVPA